MHKIVQLEIHGLIFLDFYINEYIIYDYDKESHLNYLQKQ